jgi:hypothetical protein
VSECGRQPDTFALRLAIGDTLVAVAAATPSLSGSLTDRPGIFSRRVLPTGRRYPGTTRLNFGLTGAHPFRRARRGTSGARSARHADSLVGMLTACLHSCSRVSSSRDIDHFPLHVALGRSVGEPRKPRSEEFLVVSDRSLSAQRGRVMSASREQERRQQKSGPAAALLISKHGNKCQPVRIATGRAAHDRNRRLAVEHERSYRRIPSTVQD